MFNSFYRIHDSDRTSCCKKAIDKIFMKSVSPKPLIPHPHAGARRPDEQEHAGLINRSTPA
jgi:hypothetical protein